jgi:hypothetical protein
MDSATIKYVTFAASAVILSPTGSKSLNEDEMVTSSYCLLGCVERTNITYNTVLVGNSTLYAQM